MRKLIILALVLTAGYHGYDYLKSITRGAFDDNGNPLTLIFTFDECGKPCDNAIRVFDKRHVTFEEINVSNGDVERQRYKKYGSGHEMPQIIIGNLQLTGFHRQDIISALAEAYGKDILWRHEQRIMQKHFHIDGSPKVVMYGTHWCGHCKSARKFFENNDVDYEELDIEGSIAVEQDFNVLGGAGTPLIYVGYRRISGFNEEKLKKAIELL